MNLKELFAAGAKNKQKRGTKGSNKLDKEILHTDTKVKAQAPAGGKRVDRGASRGG
jgi:hypothetical protein